MIFSIENNILGCNDNKKTFNQRSRNVTLRISVSVLFFYQL